ncbi:uncharacterized protein [Hemitrygon akajei]|uniref:uncharacterized protein n=1 Tax=Hemitrygon akajei TaxID=2704970 RepID=UPI003BF9C612
MGDLGQRLSTTPTGSTSSGTDSQSETTQEARGSAMGDLGQSLTSTPAETASSGTDSQSDATQEVQLTATGEPGTGLITTPTGSTSSGTDSQSDTTREVQETTTGEPGLGLTSSPAGSTSSVIDSALGDPCVTHTVLDQPWRSTDCYHTVCTGGQWMDDGNLEVGWYRFNSSGGWKIPETVVPQGRCSGENPGWLNAKPEFGNIRGGASPDVSQVIGELGTMNEPFFVRDKSCLTDLLEFCEELTEVIDESRAVDVVFREFEP